jgi:hypothetical protein
MQVALGLATLLGVPAAVVTFAPRVTPTVSDPVTSGDPYSSSITATNTGYIPLDKVTIGIGIGESCAGTTNCNIPVYPDPNRYEQGIFKVNIQNWGEHHLGLDERFQVPLSNVIQLVPPAKLVYADLVVVVDYEIPLIHWKREKIYPLHLGPHGEWLWG